MRDDAAAVARIEGPMGTGLTPAWRIAILVTSVSAEALLVSPSSAVPLPAPRPAVIDVHPAVPASPPLPVPRPEEDGPPLRPGAADPGREVFGPALPAVPPPPAPPEPDLACVRLMAEGKVAVHPAPPVSGPDGCGIRAPITLDAVVLKSGRRVPLMPPALMRCDLAEVLADWLRDDVVPATSAEGDLVGVVDAAAYVCRSRNGLAGLRLSEHARGNAIDILAFRFAARSVGLKGAGTHDALAPIRASACARFSTVLGPGSDAFHETDLHLDLEHRRDGFKLCQWDVP